MKIILFTILSLFPLFMNSQSMFDEPKPIEQNGKWGYIDPYEDKVIIDYQYDGARPFREQKGIVRMGRKYGVVDRMGKFIISPEYEDLGMLFNQNNQIFLNDYYFAKQNNKWGVVDENLKIMLPFEYDSLAVTIDEKMKWGRFNPRNVQLKALKKGKWGIIDFTGQTLMPFKYDNIFNLGKSEQFFYEGNDKKSLIKTLGQLKSNRNGEMEFAYFSNIYFVKQGDKNFILNKSEKIRLPKGRYDKLVKYINANQPLYLVGKGEKWGIMNEQKLITAIKYQAILSYYDDVFRFKENDKYGFFNIEGHILYPATFSSTYSHIVRTGEQGDLIDNTFTKTLLPDSLVVINPLLEGVKIGKIISSYKKLQGVMDKYGNIVIPCKYDYIYDFSLDVDNPSNMYVVQKEPNYGIIDNQDKEILPIRYKNINSVEHHRPDEVVIAKDTATNKYGLLEIQTQNWIIEPVNERLYQLEEGYATALDVDMKIIYDLSGNKISHDKYDKRNGNLVKKDGKWALLDDNDKILIPFEYDVMISLGDFFVIGGEWALGMVDSTNQIIIPIKYTSILECKDLLSIEKYSKWAIANKNGEFITDFIYDQISCQYTGDIIKVYQGGKIGALNKQGQQILPIEYNEIENYDIYLKLFKNGKFGMAHLNGNIILSCEYDDLRLSYDLSYIPVRVGNEWMFVNQKGERVKKRF